MITKWMMNLSWTRVIRLVGGFAVLIQALIANQPVAAWLGGFLLVSGFINMGCISSSCRIPIRARRGA